MKHLKPIFFKTLALFFILASITFTSLQAQGLVKIIGDSHNNYLGHLEVVNGALYSCGTNTNASGELQALLGQYDLDGNRVWETILTEIPNSTFSDFALLPNGDIYAVGSSRTVLTDANTINGLIAHFSPGGTLIEARVFPFPGRDYIGRILAKPDGSGLIAIGQDNQGATGISDVGLIYDISPNLNVTLRQHTAGGGDSQWSRGIYFTAAGDLLFYGDVPLLGGDCGLGVANADGDISGNSAYRLSTTSGFNFYIENIAEKTANLYLTGGLISPSSTSMLMSFDNALSTVRWAYELPQFSRLNDISVPDASGVFHVTAYGWNGSTMPALLKFQEIGGGVQLLSAVILQDGATQGSLANIDVVGSDIYYLQNGNGVTDGFGGYDAVFAKLDTSSYNSCISEFITAEVVLEQTEVFIQNANLNQNVIEAPFEEYHTQESVEWEQSPMCCGGLIFNDPPYEYDCAPSPTYTFTFDIANYTAVSVTSILLKNDIDPAQNVYLNLTASPIPPGGVLTGQQFNLTLTGPLTGSQQVCFDVIFLTDGSECCHFEQCIDIFPPDPCEGLSVAYEQLYEEVEEGECCYALNLVNDFCEEYFLNVTTEILTPGVTFTNYNSTLLNATANSSDNVIVWDNPGGFLPTGSLDDMSFCLGNIGSASQVPQEVAVHWYASDPLTGEPFIACSDTLTFECQPCMILEDEELVCDPATGNAVYNFSVTNMSSYVIEDIVFEGQTAGVNILPPVIDVSLAPASLPTPGGTYTGSIQFENTGGLPPGTVVQFKVVLLAADGWCCHLEVEAVLPDCSDETANCDCEDEEGFEEMLSGQAGLNHMVDCSEGGISLSTTTLTNCEQTRWVLNHPDGSSEEQFSTGNIPVEFDILANGKHQLLLEVIRNDDNGEPCPNLPASSIGYTFNVDCQSTISEVPEEEALALVINRNKTLPGDQIHVYPSPVQQTLNIELPETGNYHIEVFHSAGGKIKSYDLNWEKGQVESMDVQNWPAGIYYLKATSSHGEVSQNKFVKQ
jgi:hypothetical protein